MEKDAFYKRKELLKRKTKVYDMECRVVRIRNMDNEKGRLEAFEMFIWRRLERINWMEHRTNEEILQMVEEKRSFIGIIRSRQRKWVAPHNERSLHSKNYNRGKNGREKEKR